MVGTADFATEVEGFRNGRLYRPVVCEIQFHQLFRETELRARNSVSLNNWWN